MSFKFFSPIKQRGHILKNIDSTTACILKNATVAFLKEPFEKASLRQIVKDSGVTTGAFYARFKNKAALFDFLVAPAVKSFEVMSKTFLNKYNALQERNLNDIKNLQLISTTTLNTHLEDIFKFPTAFDLLLFHSHGTRYTNFMDEFIHLNVDLTFKYFERLRQNGIPVKAISKEEIHILAHGHYSVIYEIVKHHMLKKDAIHHLQTINNFYSAGWSFILGIPSSQS